MTLLPNHREEERPWGSFERFTLEEPATVKLLRVSPGKRFSLQRHAKRAEYWRVLEGGGMARSGGIERAVSAGDSIEVPMGAEHRLTAGPDGLVVLEIAFGAFDEGDIERLEDDFGRV